jgi:hypothetical protein
VGPFRFRLERVRAWQTKVCSIEMDKLRQTRAVLADREQTLEAFLAARVAAELELTHRASFDAVEIRAWAESRAAGVVREQALQTARDSAAVGVATQLRQFIEARRRLQQIEKLRDRELGAYSAAAAHELELLAQDSYLNGEQRRREDIRACTVLEKCIPLPILRK